MVTQHSIALRRSSCSRSIRRQSNNITAIIAITLIPLHVLTGGAQPSVAIGDTTTLPPAATRKVDFVTDIQPLLRDHCMECHTTGNEEGGLNLGIRDKTLGGGDNGKVILPGNSLESRLIELVAAIDDSQVMPPEGNRLTAEQIGLLRGWIDQGATWPDGTDIVDLRQERARHHWAYQPLNSVDAPPVVDTNWPLGPIDRFVLVRLESAQIRPAPRADARQLLRRAKFNLVGLPPTPDEVERFQHAATENHTTAYTALIDQLLQSPAYGERWGRHWLDVARYADSDGQESDRDRPTAYHYRDFVIRAMNSDMPFDQFVRWQIAGDEYEPNNPDAVAATGFLAAGPFAALPDRLMEDERLRNRYNELDDLLSTLGTGLLGLTLGCCRCHDHKYDAISARDYYSLLCAFHGGERAEVPLGKAATEKTLGYRDLDANPRPTWLFERGNYYDRDEPLQLGFINLLTRGKSPEEYWREAQSVSETTNSTNQRRALADWITDVDHGAGALLARVIVNRVWQHHFEHGIVRTVGDFGARAEPPTHPELLDWLTHDFVTHGWHIKRLQRQIMLSALFQQSGEGLSREVDLENRLLGRMPLQRLEAEVVRDAMLFVSGTLNATSFGPAVRVPIPAEAILARNLKDPYPDNIGDGPDIRRRSVYLFHKRVVPDPLQQAFDKPDAQQSCSRRDRTTVAPQALAILNDRFVRTVAGDFADRLMREGGSSAEEWVTHAFRLTLARMPTDAERIAAVDFLARQTSRRHVREPAASQSKMQRQALTDFCQVMFGLNEFVYID